MPASTTCSSPPCRPAREARSPSPAPPEPEGCCRLDVTFFESANALRAWLESHHDRASELWIGFYKKGSGTGGLTYAEAVDEALCFGWIDGVRKGLDAASYTNR